MEHKIINVLLTGATGYIGYNFSKYLEEKGINVHLLVRNTSNIRELEKRKYVKIHHYNGKSESIEIIFNKNRIDFVFHLATHYARSDDPITIAKLNDVCLNLTTQLFEIIKKQKYSIGFINVGTAIFAQNVYTLYKVFQEELVKFFSNKYEINSISLLLNDTYGPNDWRPKLLNKIKTSIKEKEEINILNPDTSINLIYIDDVCDALFHSISLLRAQEIRFNRFKLQATISIQLRDLLDLCVKTINHPINLTYGNTTNLSKDPIRVEVPILPGWEPKINLTNGLVRFFDDKERV